MKKNIVLNLSLLAMLAMGVSSCTTNANLAGSLALAPPPADAIADTYTGGILKGGGTFVSGHTYTISKANIIVEGGTLTFQAGAKVLFGGRPQLIHLGYHPTHHDLNINMVEIRRNIALKNAAHNQLSAATTTKAAGSDSLIFSIYVTGGAKVVSQGTPSRHVILTTAIANPLWPNGYWGGINCDSTTTSVNLQWTDISYTGGSDSIATNQYAFYMGGKASSKGTVVIENSSFQYGVDDCTRIEGNTQVSIKGNVFKKEGSNDGDGINIKGGVSGDVAYNYCWSGANNSIKINASLKNLAIKTRVNVYNNTVINGGWRKVGEASAGILIDANAQATVYNNLIYDCHEGLRITAASDTLYNKGKFGNNYVYARSLFNATLAFGDKEWGKPQSTDIYSKTGGDLDPMIRSFTLNILDASGFATSPVDSNDPHLLSTSPAIGKGNISAAYTVGLGTNLNFLPGKDMGAYQMDGTGNARIN